MAIQDSRTGGCSFVATSSSSPGDVVAASVDGPNGYRGVLVLVCGIPGCGKDLIGRECAQHFANSAALSQDEHGGSAASTQAAAEMLLREGRSPIFILRNGVDASDRLPYVHAARRNGYRVIAVCPAELSSGDMHSRVALYLVSIAGCYCRLTAGGRVGHETLTIGNEPAKVCLSFLRSFRTPAAPGEVDCVLSLPFLGDTDWPSRLDILVTEDSGTVDSVVACVEAKILKAGNLPDSVASLLCHGFEETKAKLLPFTTMRRSSSELVEELVQWVTSQLPQEMCVESRPSDASCTGVPTRRETQRLQREIKIRAAVEHLISPANIAKCRSNGSTVTNCVWLPTAEECLRHRPAWPLTHFCNSPQLRRLGVSEEEVVAAVRASAISGCPLQQGDDGVCAEILSSQTNAVNARSEVLVSPLQPLPDASLRKLRCFD